MLYAAVYFGGIRYYPAANTVLNTAPAVKDTTSVLVLTEDGIARDYDIKVTEKYTLEGVTPSPVFSGTIQKTRTLDEVAVRNAVDDILSSVERKGGTPGYITHDCKYIPPQKGNLVDKDRLEADIMSDFPDKSGYDVNDYYIEEEDDDSQRLKELIDALEASQITYSNGKTIKASEMDPVYIRSLASVSLNSTKIRDAAMDISLSYDDIGKKTVQFDSTLRGIVDVSGGTWGTLTDTEAEMDAAEEILDSLEVSENRIPVCRQYLTFDLPDTYIEVDKENQRVFVYENGRLIMSCDCVTGRVPDRKTPSGIFFISECAKNKTLRGPGYASFVNRWMRLTNSGIGLHDATWRRSFGGSIYMHDGSHGCINLPKDFAYELYDWVQTKENLCTIVF